MNSVTSKLAPLLRQWEGPLTQEQLSGGNDLALRYLRGPPAPPCGDPWALIPGVHRVSLSTRFTILEPS